MPQFKLTSLALSIKQILSEIDKYNKPFIHYEEPEDDE